MRTFACLLVFLAFSQSLFAQDEPQKNSYWSAGLKAGYAQGVQVAHQWDGPTGILLELTSRGKEGAFLSSFHYQRHESIAELFGVEAGDFTWYWSAGLHLGNYSKLLERAGGKFGLGPNFGGGIQYRFASFPFVVGMHYRLVVDFNLDTGNNALFNDPGISIRYTF